MGAISDALSKASGVVSKGVNSATNATGLTSGAGASSAGASGSMPQMDISQQILSAGGMDPSQVSLSGPGVAPGTLGAANPNAPQSVIPGLSLNDLLGTNPQGAQQLAMSTNPGVNNPYSNIYQQSTPDAAAASIGTPDSWQPSHHESTIAKIGDFFFHNMFRDRTVEANERDALKASTIDGKLDPNLAAQRLEQIPGSNPAAGPGLIERMAQANAYQGMGEQRQDSARDKATGIISNAFGPSSAIMTAPSDQQAALYGTVRPLLYTMGQNAGLPTKTLDQMLPEQFNPDVAKTVGTMGMSGFDQGRLALEGSRTVQQQNYQNQEINLRKAGLVLQQAELGVHAATAQSDITKNQSEIDKNAEGSLTQRQALYTKVLGPAAKIPWLYGNFVKGTFGGGSAGMPKPGTAYVSPDKTAAAEMTSQGQWKIYDITKGSNHAKLVGTLGGAIGNTSANGDFVQ